MMSVVVVVCSVCVYLSMCLVVLCVLCLTVLVNCLLLLYSPFNHPRHYSR